MNIFEQALTKVWPPPLLEKIQRTRIGVAGAGGLGANCAALLVRSGFRKLTIVDFDRVEISNLNRQPYFQPQVGSKKVIALRQLLCKINPNLDLKLYDQRITRDNAEVLFKECFVVVEALDGAEDKAMLLEALAGKAFLVAASGIGGWGESERIGIRKVGAGIRVVGDGKSDVKKTAPVAPIVMLAAAKQADLVLEFVCQEEIH